MIETALGTNIAFTAPHRLATKAGFDILEAGGSAVEAMVAAAAQIAVVYPHMNSIGGDGFWLIKKEGKNPVAISACGPAAQNANLDWYAEKGHSKTIPTRGPLAALTVPGTISGWQLALELDRSVSPIPLTELLSAAINKAKIGIAVSKNQYDTLKSKELELAEVPGFKEFYFTENDVPKAGSKLIQAKLGETLERLSRAGLGDFYTGELGQTHAKFLQQQGSPLTHDDFKKFRAEVQKPLSINTSVGKLFNLGPPTQGMSSLAILGIYDRIKTESHDDFNFVHRLVEATKQAFITRNLELGDPAAMRTSPERFISDSYLDQSTSKISLTKAMDWPEVAKKGDTIWMGAVDSEGTVVSFIQSIFWEFGSGVICPETGVLFQNRGAGFSLSPGPNCLAPGKKPFHTLNPAMAVMNDGRIVSYGTMGGEGQPQTQAAIFARYAFHGCDLQRAISAPRWLLGKTWGDDTTSLKLESSFDAKLINELREANHQVEIVSENNSLMGHAGSVVSHPDGRVEAASDARSDGIALAG